MVVEWNFKSQNVYEGMSEEQLRELRELNYVRTDKLIKEYGLRWRSASGIASEMDYIQSFGVKPKDLDRFVDMLLKIGYDRGADKDRR